MPGGHASHKSTSNKPNVNTSGQINPDTANPEDELLEGATTNTTRTQEFVDYPPAVERPESPAEEPDDRE